MKKIKKRGKQSQWLLDQNNKTNFVIFFFFLFFSCSETQKKKKELYLYNYELPKGFSVVNKKEYFESGTILFKFDSIYEIKKENVKANIVLRGYPKKNIKRLIDKQMNDFINNRKEEKESFRVLDSVKLFKNNLLYVDYIYGNPDSLLYFLYIEKYFDNKYVKLNAEGSFLDITTKKEIINSIINYGN